MTPSEITAIARCTRDGVTSWFNVARMLGVSVDQARSRFDPKYHRPNPFRDRETQKVADYAAAIDEVRASPAKAHPLRMRILEQLAKLSATREEVHLRLAISSGTANVMLSTMKTEGLVTHDGVPRGRCLWSITEAGKTMLKAREAA